MSLLDNIENVMINPFFESAIESDTDTELDFEFALESIVDKKVDTDLSDDDISAILDDDNPDNIGADLGLNDENLNKIKKDAVAQESLDDFADLELMLTALESDNSFEDDDTIDLEEPANEENESVDDESIDNEDYPTLDSLLNDILK